MKFQLGVCTLLAWLILLTGCQSIQPVPAGDQAQPATAKTAATTVLYETGFEPPTFKLGELDGQSGWQQRIGPGAGVRVGKVGGATISDVAPASGVQSQRNDGSMMTPVPYRPWSGVLVSYALNYDVVAHKTPLLEVEADVRLDGPNTVDDKISANLVATAVDKAGSLASLAFNQLSSSGKVLTTGEGNAPVALAKYHRLGLRLDFSKQEAEYFLDGVSFGIEPFRDTREAVALYSIRLDLVGDPTVGSQYTAYYDNLVVRVVTP